ncbi:MAG: glycerophosphodiester phosphodiesterase family protein [Bacteroidota bacterium]
MKPIHVLLFFFLVFLYACQEAVVESQIFKIPDDQLDEFFEYRKDRIPLISAHRGGRGLRGYPENALETFEYVTSQIPAIIEMDVEMTKDSVLILLHDNTLDRTTTGQGPVKNFTWKQIQELRLVDDFNEITNFKVPLFEDVLQWADKRTILMVDIKKGVPYERVVDAIKKYGMNEYAVVITYSAGAAQRLHRLHPGLMLSVSMRNEEEVERLLKTGIPTRNMVAFTGTVDSGPALYERIHQEGISCILGVLGNIDKKAEARGPRVYRECLEHGADILATDRPLEAAKAIQSLIPENSSKSSYLVGME